MKKTLSVFLSLVLALTALGVFGGAANAQETVLAEGTCGDNISWKITDDGALILSGSGKLKPLQREVEYDMIIEEDGEEYVEHVVEMQSYYPWEDAFFTVCSAHFGYPDVDSFYEAVDAGEEEYEAFDRYYYFLTKSIIIEEGITAVPENAFYSYMPEVISLPSSLKNVGESAFDCSFSSQIILNNPRLNLNGAISLNGYTGDEAPFASREEAVECIITGNIDVWDSVYGYYLGNEPTYFTFGFDGNDELFEIEGEITPFSWITVYGGKNSTAQAAASVSRVNFVEIEVPDVPADEPQGFFAKIVAFFEKLARRVKDFFALLRACFFGVLPL